MRFNINKNIGVWNIILVDRHNRVLLIDGVENRGVTKYSSRKIYIDRTLSRIDLKRVLIHELAHVYIYESQLDNRLEKRYSEEELCEFIARYAEEILRLANRIYKRLLERL